MARWLSFKFVRTDGSKTKNVYVDKSHVHTRITQSVVFRSETITEMLLVASREIHDY